MSILYFCLAILVITAGHYFRTKRWKSLISVYEEIEEATLLRSMSYGYFLNILLPFRIGDIFRAVYCGRRLKNKTSFALSTIIIDRLLDVFIVAILYGIFFLCRDSGCLRQLIVYSAASAVLFGFAFWALCFSRPVKKVVLTVSSVFNGDIQLWLLSFVWSSISTIRNILHKIDKAALLLRTIAMWLCYLASYFLFSRASDHRSMLSVFNSMFSSSSILPIVKYYRDLQDSSCFPPSLLAFELATCAALLILAYMHSKLVWKRSTRPAELILPYTNSNSRLDFLRVYFSDIRDKNYIRSFLSINKDVTILRNCSAGSNATTLLCIRNDQMIYRKYAFEKDCDTLYAQVNWLLENKDDLSVTEILEFDKQEMSCWYDMPYYSQAVCFFDYIHSSPEDASWKILSTVLSDLETHYQARPGKPADPETIEKYIESKVISNIKKIHSSSLHHLASYPEILINGVIYKNLPYFLDKLTDKAFWVELLKDDSYCDIHGDMTIENIICHNEAPHGYYLIDPNTNNLHNSPTLDYAKMLQSLHGNYEFLMHTPKVHAERNIINFNMTRSSAYDKLYGHYRDYLNGHFDRKYVKSIYFQEIIHWLRLMPYKIANDSDRAPMFYAEMITVINDIFKEFSES